MKYLIVILGAIAFMQTAQAGGGKGFVGPVCQTHAGGTVSMGDMMPEYSLNQLFSDKELKFVKDTKAKKSSIEKFFYFGLKVTTCSTESEPVIQFETRNKELLSNKKLRRVNGFFADILAFDNNGDLQISGVTDTGYAVKAIIYYSQAHFLSEDVPAQLILEDGNLVIDDMWPIGDREFLRSLK